MSQAIPNPSASAAHLSVRAEQAIQNLKPVDLEKCIDEGFDPNEDWVYDDRHPLLAAASLGSWHCLEVLLRRGALPQRAASPTGNTPLKMACVYGHLKAIEMLLVHGDDPNAQPTPELKSCMHIVAKSNFVNATQILQALCNAGGRLDLRDQEHNTPLHDAVWQKKSIDWLVAQQPELLSARNNMGETPLMYAIGRRMDASALNLLEYPQNLQLKNKEGQTARSLADLAQMKSVIERIDAITHATAMHQAISKIAEQAKAGQGSQAKPR